MLNSASTHRITFWSFCLSSSFPSFLAKQVNSYDITSSSLFFSLVLTKFSYDLILCLVSQKTYFTVHMRKKIILPLSHDSCNICIRISYTDCTNYYGIEAVYSYIYVKTFNPHLIMLKKEKNHFICFPFSILFN